MEMRAVVEKHQSIKIQNYSKENPCIAPYELKNCQGNAYGHDKNHKEGAQVPIDGGISLLIAAGAAFGAKKLFINNKKNSINP